MKTGLSTLPILFLLTLIGCETTRAELPEPQKAVGFALRADPVQWEPQNMSEGEGGILIEMVPAGHEISEWTELLVQQILFNDLGFERFGLWREIILNSDLVENPELARAIAE